MREKLIFPSRSLIVLSLIFECLAATGSWRIQTRRILIENGLDVCLPKRVLKSKNVRIDEEYIYLLEPDLKAGIENRDERNWPQGCEIGRKNALSLEAKSCIVNAGYFAENSLMKE